MIITQRFVFIHMHKTGGQTLNDILRRCIPAHRSVGYNFPHSEVPPEFEALPRVGMVRNPWDWYLSWYAFNQDPAIENPLYEVVSDGGRADFITTLTRLIKPGSNSSESQRARDAPILILVFEQCEQDAGAMPDFYGHSITYRIALGPQRGKKVFTLQTLLPSPLGDSRVKLAKEAGFSLHAGVAARYE